MGASLSDAELSELAAALRGGGGEAGTVDLGLLETLLKKHRPKEPMPLAQLRYPRVPRSPIEMLYCDAELRVA